MSDDSNKAGLPALPGPGTELVPVEKPVRKLEPPALYRVVLHNDDFTSMDFVVDVLVRHFAKPLEEAMRLMLQVHREGAAVGGVYPREIAETKAEAVMAEAESRGMPFLVTCEPE